MSYSSSALHGRSAYNAYYSEQLGYAPGHALPIDDPVDPNLQSLIDPSLRVSSPTQYTDFPWESHQMQQFIKEPANAFFAPVPSMQPSQTSFPRYHLQPTPLPPLSQGRHGSPFSQQLSCASSDSLSPPTVSDVLPSTPPDTTAWSPNLIPSQCLDRLDLDRNIFFVGQGGVFVNPRDVNPPDMENQEMFDSDPVPNFERVYSFGSSTDSQYDGETFGNIAPSLEMAPRAMSPEDAPAQIKDEIHVGEPMPCSITAYPDLLADEDGALEIDARIKTQREDEDQEWKSKEGPKTNVKKRARGCQIKAQLTGSKSSNGANSHQRKRMRVDRAMNRDSAAHTKTGTSVPAVARTKFVCHDCTNPTSFTDEAGLQKHVKQQHTRPFVCVFRYAGCDSDFATKNEWKRHVVSQHLVLQYWHCTQDNCGKTQIAPNGGSRRGSASPKNTTELTVPTHGALFNRKDLYTQHVRRMHVPPAVRKAHKQKKPTPEWDEHLKSLQNAAMRERCKLPTSMRCPDINCTSKFNGPTAWDDRMEHVGKHLEGAADPTTDEPLVQFGGDEDPTLTAWAASPQVAVVKKRPDGTWELVNPLKCDNGGSNASDPKKGNRASDQGDDSEVDAEGEDE